MPDVSTQGTLGMLSPDEIKQAQIKACFMTRFVVCWSLGCACSTTQCPNCNVVIAAAWSAQAGVQIAGLEEHLMVVGVLLAADDCDRHGRCAKGVWDSSLD